MKQQHPPSSKAQVSGFSPQPSDGLVPKPSDDDVLVRVENVSKKFCRDLKKSLWYGMKDLGSELIGQNRDSDELRPDEFWAVKDVSFELRRGECLGLIGRNGAGKTTLLRMLNGLIKPDKGRIEMRGRVGALIALGAGFNPILTGRENIYVNAAVLGLSKKETDEKLEEILEFAELGEFIDAPVQTYSSGMQVRLGFSVATTLKPEVLLLDEILAVGDVHFRGKCWKKIGELLVSSAVILVSHESYAISRLCDRALFLSKGEVKCNTSSSKALLFYSNSISNKKQLKPEHYLHKSISYYSIRCIKKYLKKGESFDFFLYLDTMEDFTIDHALINILDYNGDIHAQCLPRLPNLRLVSGRNILYCRIASLFLSKGEYSLIMLFSIDNGKTPFIHSIYELSFNFENNVNFGPKYYPDGQIIRVKNDVKYLR